MRLTARQQTLVTANLRLAYFTAAKLHPAYAHRITLEEASSACLEGLCEAVATFEPSRGCRLSTHAVWRMRVAVKREALAAGGVDVPRDFLRSHRGEQIALRKIAERHGVPSTRERYGRNGEQQVDDADAVRWILRDLPPDLAEVVRGLTLLGFYSHELAERTGTPAATLRGRHARAMKLLARQWAEGRMA